MGREIDERIVAMYFDNNQFAKGAQPVFNEMADKAWKEITS